MVRQAFNRQITHDFCTHKDTVSDVPDLCIGTEAKGLHKLIRDENGIKQ